MSKGHEPGRIEALTGVRGVAALWVLLHHLAGTFPVSDYLAAMVMTPSPWAWMIHALRNIADKGWLGVDLFFILSGFVISYVHRDEFATFRSERYLRFLTLRIARIYPAHITTTLLLIPMFATAWALFSYRPQGSALSLEKLAYSLLLIHGWGIPNSVG